MFSLIRESRPKKGRRGVQNGDFWGMGTSGRGKTDREGEGRHASDQRTLHTQMKIE
jgi:hypothetical protein